MNVGLTMLFATLIALLLGAWGKYMRSALAGLVLVWATPVVVVISSGGVMVDFEFGVLNWTLTKLYIVDLVHSTGSPTP